MEFKPEEIAKLVLGYLREHKCQTAFLEFLSSSPFLKEHCSNHRRGKYVATRVHGLSLVDYLLEYALVYSIVQEHIEATDYYNERGLRTSLSQQLLYLLNSSSATQSRTSTPIQHNVPVDVHVSSNKSNFTTPTDNTINQALNIISGNSSVIPVQSWSSNSSTELSFLNSARKKVANVDKSTSVDVDVDREKSQEMCKEIFTQTFLDNSILCEKLADNINKEVSAKSSTLEDPSNFHIGRESIESIIQRIATDPIIVNSIEEIIGGEEDEPESPVTPPNRNVSNVEDKIQSNTSKERVVLSTPKKTQNVNSSESIKTRLRSSKKSSSSSAVNDVALIEQQNNEVVESIIAASMSGEKQCPDQELDNSNSQTPTMGEVMLTEQIYDNLINTSEISGPSNQIYVNTVNSGGLLMVQPNLPSSCPNIVSAKGMQVDPTKPYYIFGNQQFGNVILPHTPYKVSNVITEQDIMSMPTIIVCDNNQQFNTSSQTAVVSAPATSQNHPRAIAPRKTVAKAQSLSEYISLYQCNDPGSPIIYQPQPVASPPNQKLKSKATTDANPIKSKTDKKISQKLCKIQAPAETSTENVLKVLNNNDNKLEAVVENTVSESVETEADSVYDEEQPNTSRIKPLGDSMPQILTPKMMMVQDVKERRSRSTPRNGSHVRQLDFSTPDKWCPIARRANTSPKVDRTLEKETPVKAPKSGSVKSIRTSLFKSPDLEIPAEASNLSTADNVKENDKNKADMGANETPETHSGQTVKGTKSCSVNLSWDADLRALAAPSDVEESVSQKPKRKRSEECIKKHVAGKQSKEILNKTEDDASKIELALANDESQIENGQNIVTKTAQDNGKNVKNSNTRRNRSSSKKSNKIIKTDEDKSVKVINTSRENSSATTKISNVEEQTLKPDYQQKVASEEVSPEKQYEVINRHVKSRIKKKCNMENPTKKSQTTEEIILTNITKIKSCEILEDSKNKLILSPSKLNANKRTLVEVENRSPIEIASSTSNDTRDVIGSKLITPELVKSSTNIPPSAAKRNIMPILETPVKFDSVLFPKTPSISTPSVVDTPFTKAVLDQLTGVDINDIPTPKFPITPNVPFTPAAAVGNEQSPFSNRPTDYSTSSSYYQPSDNEQNKSLEQLIEECRKLDSQSNKADDCDGTSSIHPERLEISEAIQKTELNELLNISISSPEVTDTSVTDKMKAFNHSMIGKKNLQLVKMFSNETEKDEDESSSDTSSTGTSTTSSDDSDSSDSDESVNVTPVKNVTPPYSLRPRKVPTNSTTPDLNASGKERTEGQNIASVQKEQNFVNTKEKFFQDGLLQEMEAKRQRTIARFKTASSTTASSTAKTKENSRQKKPVVKRKESGKATAVKMDNSIKVLREKSAPKKLVTNKLNPKKAEQTKTEKENSILKSSNNQPDQSQAPQLSSISFQQNEHFSTLKQADYLIPTRTSIISTKKAKAIVNDDKEIVLHLSSDDENLEPSKLVEAVLLECSTSPQPTGEADPESLGTSDQETETWVKLKGLMQMGIHLIPNKSVKKSVISSDEMDPEKEPKENVSGSGNDQSAQCDNEETLTHAPANDSTQEKRIEERKNEKPVDNKPKVKKAAVTNTMEPVQTKHTAHRIPTKQKRENPEKNETVRKPEASKERCANRLNRSLEEGELMSDEDRSPRKENKYKKFKEEDIKKTKSRSTSNSRRSNSDKERIRQKDRSRDFRESYGYRPRADERSNKPVSVSKSYPSSSSKSSSKNKIPDKTTKLNNKPLEKSIEIIPPKNDATTPQQAIQQTVVNNELDYQVQFSDKTYTEETYRITHDYSKQSNRTLNDYNLDILTKKFSANVYIAEIDSEVEKFLSFTPFQFLLDIPAEIEKKTSSSYKSSKPHVSKEPSKIKKKPLTILYNQLIKPADEIERPSLLEDLYEPAVTARDRKRSIEKDRSKIVGKSQITEKSQTSNRSKHKSKSSDEEHVLDKNLEMKYKSEKQVSTGISNKTDINPECNVPLINLDGVKSTSGVLMDCGDQGTKRLPDDLEQDLQVIHGVIMLNTSKDDQKKDLFETSFESNDELMNYALVGSERVENNDNLLLTTDNSKKRKLPEEEGDNQQEKKQKTEELLRNIDVDSFLKKLHGET